MSRRPAALLPAALLAALLTMAGQPGGPSAATARPAGDVAAEEPRLDSARPPLSAGLFFDPSRQTLCQLVETAAADNALPVPFFARLIHAESRFDPAAVSPKGAQGIAQFIRSTADLRGLADPFDPITAIRASADYLADLRLRYGNLGLAAAAYNAGEGRVSGWLAGRGGLPLETRNYVWKITGRSPEDWRVNGAGEESEPDEAGETDAEAEPGCLEIASGRGGLRPDRLATAPATAPWGVQLAGNHSLNVAMGSYRRLQQRFPGVLGGIEPMVVTRRIGGRGPGTFYRMQAPAQDRQEAQRLCVALRKAGGDCLVQRNR